MTSLFEDFQQDGSTVIGVVGDWTRSVAEWDCPRVTGTQTRQGGGAFGGEVNVGPWLPLPRTWSVTFRSVLTGSVTNAAGAAQDEIDSLNNLWHQGVEYEITITRKDADNADVDSIITAQVVTAPSWNIVPSKGTGVVARSDSGHILFTVEFYSRWPYFGRVKTASGKSGSWTTPTIGGEYPANAKFTVATKSGTVTSFSITNSTPTPSVAIGGAGSISVGEVVDWGYTLRNEPTWTLAAANINAGSSFHLETGGTNAVAFAVVGGGSATWDVAWLENHASP